MYNGRSDDHIHTPAAAHEVGTVSMSEEAFNEAFGSSRLADRVTAAPASAARSRLAASRPGLSRNDSSKSSQRLSDCRHDPVLAGQFSPRTGGFEILEIVH